MGADQADILPGTAQLRCQILDRANAAVDFHLIALFLQKSGHFFRAAVKPGIAAENNADFLLRRFFNQPQDCLRCNGF